MTVVHFLHANLAVQIFDSQLFHPKYNPTTYLCDSTNANTSVALSHRESTSRETHPLILAFYLDCSHYPHHLDHITYQCSLNSEPSFHLDLYALTLQFYSWARLVIENLHFGTSTMSLISCKSTNPSCNPHPLWSNLSAHPPHHFHWPRSYSMLAPFHYVAFSPKIVT